MSRDSLREAELVAAKLTKAQRLYLTRYARFKSPAIGHERRWMTFPPRNTHGVLIRLGLVDGCGQISPFGLEAAAAIRSTLTDANGEPCNDESGPHD